jgi:hypothetical protein
MQFDGLQAGRMVLMMTFDIYRCYSSLVQGKIYQVREFLVFFLMNIQIRCSSSAIVNLII